MKIFAALIGICFFCSASAQIEGFEFTSLQTDTCNSTDSVHNYTNWYAYQTIENTWDGTIDTLICIDIADASGMKINYNQVDLTRPVFLRWRNPAGLLLDEDGVFLMHWWCSSMGDLEMDNPNFCYNDLCDGVRMGIEVPNSETGTNEMRWYTQEFFDQQPMYVCDLDFSFCFPTESFSAGNRLRELILQMKFLETVNNNDSFHIEEINIGEVEPDCLNIIEEPSIQNMQSGNNIYFQDWNACYLANYWNLLSWPNDCTMGSPYLVKWQGVGFPSANNKYYLDLYPSANPDVQQTITINVPEMAHLNYQPFTYFRGGLVDGSDTLRHNISYQVSGELCIGMFIDVVMGPHDEFVMYPSGMVNLQSGRSCLQWSGHATMRVKENAIFNYGANGQGMLASYGTCAFYLEKNAELNINSTIVIEDHDNGPMGTTVDVYLSPGSHLNFGPLCKVVNWSREENVKWVIHCDRAFVDFSELTESERSHFILVYPHDEKAISVLAVFSNPVADDLKFSLHSDRSNSSTLYIYNDMGQQMAAIGKTLQEGYNVVQLPVNQLATGNYLLKIKSEIGEDVFRFMKY